MKANLFIVRILGYSSMISYLVFQINSLCTIQQKCDVIDDKCNPAPANNTEPQILTGDNIMCPEYANQPACCNTIQNILIKKNFDALEAVFSSRYGGCDICLTNLKRFWCHFTCHPEQHTFLNTSGYGKYIIDGKEWTLLNLNFTLNNKMNCDLFNSCKKTKFAAQVPAMGNAIGFTTFQGSEAYTKSNVWIQMNYQAQGGLSYDIDPCDTLPDKDNTVRGFKIYQNCTCNSCDRYCNFTMNSYMPVLEGFSLLTVGIFYIVIIVFTVGIFFLKRHFRKTNPIDARSRSSTEEYIGINEIHKVNSGEITSNLSDERSK